MFRYLTALLLAASTCLAFAATPPGVDLHKKPITTDTSEIGKLLTQWHREGTAAGNVGDWYDNRDGEHSPLDLRPWPQLQKVTYSEDDIKARRHWALMTRTRPQVTFGNSSTSGPAHLNGSNPRTAYSVGEGLEILQRQYRGNNLYLYPEHRDHDVGHNGVGDGYGDLYPTNTPYVLISQGSSGSDQPFMRALPFTLAAFRPDVKKKLTDSGLLMPTVQMLFRASNKHLREAKDYLTGKAHPTVFEGTHVDALKMVKIAHAIRADDIPPLVKLTVVEEEKLTSGKDYFEPAGLGEKLGDTDGVVARIWRGVGGKRRLVLSAAESLDVNKRPLTFTWVVLRGDPKRITIVPKGAKRESAEITIRYHERRPIAPRSEMHSNRVDIGVFAHNGSHYSAPSFLTYFSLDSESRSYDEKERGVEVGYATGETEVKVPEYGKVFTALGTEGLAATVFGLDESQRKELAALGKVVSLEEKELQRLRTERQQIEAKHNTATNALRTAEAALAVAKKKGDNLDQAETEVKLMKARLGEQDGQLKSIAARLTRSEADFERLMKLERPALKAGPRAFVTNAILRAVRAPTLWNDHLEALMKTYADAPQRQARIDAARRKLLQLGIVVNGNQKRIEFRPAMPGKSDSVSRLSAFERSVLEEFNAALLGELILPDLVTRTFRLNFVDARLSTPKPWRDVYLYEGDTLVGWTRYHVGPTNRTEEFTPEGWLIVAKDDKGRAIQARTVSYGQEPSRQTNWVNTNPLRLTKGDELITFRYDGNKRIIDSREKVPER